MTGKQQAMVTERLKDPKAPNSTIIKRAGYNLTGTGNRPTNTASQIYLENMRNPEISKALESVVDEVEQVLIDNVREYRDSDKQWQRQLSNDNAKWIREAVRGKAIQQIQTTTTGVTLNLDLTSSLAEPTD